MTTVLTVYCLLVLVASIAGGWVPFRNSPTHSRLQLYLSISAGVMLGASFFHVMPEAMEAAKETFGWWMSLGVVGLFCIERFIAPHSHEMGGEHHHDCDHDHAHDHDGDAKTDHRAAAPPVAGWMAVLGLTIHTFMNGVGLAGAVQAGIMLGHSDGEAQTWLAKFAPGLAMFLAIVLHKPADALAITTVLSRKGVSWRMIMFVQVGFALMVPVGVVCFVLLGQSLTANLQSQLTGAALAFSAGTFLFIALSDLLPEVQFHRHDRFKLFLALTAGVAFMGGVALLEGHHHGAGDHDHDHVVKVKPADGPQKKTADHDRDHEDPDHDHGKAEHNHK